MKASYYFSRVGLVFSAIGLILVLFRDSLQLNASFNYGLGFFVAGVLIMALGLILDRLDRLGMSAWVLGSFIFYIGFLAFSSPLVIFVINANLVPISTRSVLYVSGIVLMFFGYGLERWDLNEKFVKFIVNSYERFRSAIHKTIDRLRKSPLVVAFILFYILTITTWLAQDYIDSQLQLPITSMQLVFVFAGIGILLTLIEIREMIYSTVITLSSSIIFVIRGVVAGILEIPRYIKIILNALGRGVINLAYYIGLFFRKLKGFVVYIVKNSFIVAFITTLLALILALIFTDSYYYMVAALGAVFSLGLLIDQKRSRVEAFVGGVQSTVMRRGYRVARRFRRPQGVCPYCNEPYTKEQMKHYYCLSCMHPLQGCMICKLPIGRDDDVLSCPSCGYPAHREHIKNWLALKPECPRCKSPWYLE